jgi:excisionase family DNA binding protein
MVVQVLPRVEEFTRLLEIAEAADRLRLKSGTVKLWARQRRIARVKLGSRIFIPETEVQRLIEANLIPAEEAGR